MPAPNALDAPAPGWATDAASGAASAASGAAGSVTDAAAKSAGGIMSTIKGLFGK